MAQRKRPQKRKPTTAGQAARDGLITAVFVFAAAAISHVSCPEGPLSLAVFSGQAEGSAATLCRVVYTVNAGARWHAGDAQTPQLPSAPPCNTCRPASLLARLRLSLYSSQSLPWLCTTRLFVYLRVIAPGACSLPSLPHPCWA